MRRCTLLIALAVPVTVTVTAPAPAVAAPTAEERALLALLQGRDAEAVRVLEAAASEDPQLRLLAGRVALARGDRAAARRLLSGPDPAAAWGRIELDLASGRAAEAATAAIAELDRALGGVHREAIAGLLVRWASDLAPRDAGTAAKMLVAVLDLDTSADLRRTAEDALLRAQGPKPDARAAAVARRRVAAEGAVPDLPARRVAGAALAGPAPDRALALLDPVVRGAPREEALAAARTVAGLAVPDADRTALLDALGPRFPDDPDAGRVRLDWGKALAARDEAAGSVLLLALASHATVGAEAMEAWARAATDPADRRARWTRVAEREGATARGDLARKEALAALRAAVIATAEGEPRRAAAAEALRVPGMEGDPVVPRLAIPAGPGRADALWALASRFPAGGDWCDECARGLVASGAVLADAERFTKACPSASGHEAAALAALESGDESLVLAPAAGAVKALATGAPALRVTEHDVDPEALFRATDGHPLETAMDAFLVESGTRYEVGLDAARLDWRLLRPRSGAALVAVQVRGKDRQATALVVPDPIRLEVVVKGDSAAVLATRGGRAVPGCALTLRSDAPEPRHARADARGIAIITGLSGAVRVMARDGRALGFAVTEGAEDAAPRKDRVTILPLDRAFPAAGARRPFLAVATRLDGAAAGRVRLESATADGEPLDAAEASLAGGAAVVELFVQGGGTVTASRGGETAVEVPLPVAPEAAGPGVAISFDPPSPMPGGRVAIRVHDLRPAPDGREARVAVTAPWTRERVDAPAGPAPIEVVLDLASAAPGDRIEADATVGDERVLAHVVVGRASPAPPPKAPAERRAKARPPYDLFAVTADRVLAAGTSAPDRGAVPPTMSAWVVSSDPEADPLPLPAPEVPVLAIGGALSRDTESTLSLADGLPAGTRVWAVLRDASDAGPVPAAPDLQETWSGPPGGAAEPWEPQPVEGEAIAEALLQEEERAEEAKAPVRIHMGAASTKEMQALGRVSGTGYGGAGAGGGGAAFGHAGSVRMGKAEALRAVAPSYLPGAIASVLAAGPGTWRVRVPASVTQTHALAVARLPDGRWISTSRHLAVGGAAPVAAAPHRVPGPPETWDGSRDALAAVAATLPPDARTLALAALVRRGHATSLPALRAARAEAGGEEAGAAVASKLGHGTAPAGDGAARRLEGLPDPRLAERAEAALEAAAGEPERAVAAARRVVGAAEASAWARARPALALWVAGEQAEAEAALAGEQAEAEAALAGEQAPLVAARALVTGRTEPRHASLLWAVARSPAALPLDRAIAIAALSGRAVPGAAGPAASAPREASPASLEVRVDPPLAELHGRTFARGATVSTRRGHEVALPPATTVPAGRTVPVRVEIPPSPDPSRVACPDGAVQPWLDLDPAWAARVVECRVRPAVPGAADLVVTWTGPSGEPLAAGSARGAVGPAHASGAGDAMSPDEAHGLGVALAGRGDPAGPALLAPLLASEWLAPPAVASASAALLDAARLSGGPAALVAAFEAHRERAGSGTLDVATAAAVARAYAATGRPARAVAAARVVLDARFREELSAVRGVHAAGLALSAVQLVRELVARYPEGPAAIEARRLAPALLLDLADRDGDRLGYTRSSLRHTAAAGLAAFLLLHLGDPGAPDAAGTLIDALAMLRDPAREQALAGPLAARYRKSDNAWRLSVADARARFARARFADAAAVLLALPDSAREEPEVAVLLGRVHEALGRRAEALREYERASGEPEADARAAWLSRSEFGVPRFRVLAPGEPATVRAALRPGTPAAVAAYRIRLEDLLLRDAGEPDPDSVRVDGLEPEAAVTVRVDASGDVPLPSLAPGPYLLAVTLGDETRRCILVRTDARITLTDGPSGGTLLHLSDGRGRPVPGAAVWAFESGTPVAERTDPTGAAWLAAASTDLRVLARKGALYAWWSPDASGTVTNGVVSGTGSAAPAPAGTPAVRQKTYDFDDLLIDGDLKGVRTNAL
ncbi:MAG: hypothetical protein FJ087_14320 [Deltaproteobacteria bacterium]|nr:hypothetical protein [Deltaproteobacteria bacterium]